ncbi:MAG: DUF4325 domain-containing protein [Burkholderiaceae bacterium]
MPKDDAAKAIRALLDNFDGIQEIGQAFADELFRVYGAAHHLTSIAI